MGERKPTVTTSISADSLRGPLTDAWTDKFGTAPKPLSIALLLAHVGLETGWHACQNYNLGNQKATPGGKDDWCFFTTWELVPRAVAESMVASHPNEAILVSTDNQGMSKVVLKPDHPGCCFRSFDTLQDGVSSYMDLLFRRFAPCWPAVRAGEPEAFALLLKQMRYYTAPLEDYTRGLVVRFDQCSLPKLASQGEVDLALARLGFDDVLSFQKAKMGPKDQDGKIGPRTRIAMRRCLQALE